MIAYLTILGILGVSTAARLNNISLSSFEDVVDKNDFALVACKQETLASLSFHHFSPLA